MFRLLAKRFDNSRLKVKIIVIALLSVAITAATAFLSLSFVTSRYNGLLYSTLADSLSIYIRDIEAGLDSIENASSFMATDRDVQNNLTAITGEAGEYDAYLSRAGIYTSLHRYIVQNRYIKAISVVPATENQNVISTHTLDPSSPDYQFIAEQARASGDTAMWLQDHAGILHAQTIRQLQGVSLRELGVLIIEIDLDRIIYDLRINSGRSTSQSVAIVSNGELLYPAGDSSGWESAETDAPYFIREIGGVRQFVVRRSVGELGWVYLCGIPYDDVFRSIQASVWMYVFAVVSAIVISIVIASAMTRNITRHFDSLGHKMRSFAGGNLKPVEQSYDYGARKDELGAAHRHFDAMLKDIADLIDDNYVKQLLIKETQLKSLEQQINPHFLYNTLNSIHWQARAAGQNQIAGMVKALSKLMQASLSETGDAIPLNREMELIGHYIEIQKIRYEERLEYIVDIEPNLNELPVPKMCIQPLVENAVMYALEVSSAICAVTVAARSEGETAIVSVTNSGSSIDEDILEKLRSGAVLPGGHGIGLLNIDARIKLLFGEDYGLTAKNGANGATVAMRLPLPKRIIEEVALDDAAVDC